MKTCNCGSTNITHEEKPGRGLPPKGYIKKNNKKISWKGIWDFYTCIDCGVIDKKLRR